MNLSDFQRSAERTMVKGMPGLKLMANAALGLSEEAAEIDECVAASWSQTSDDLLNETGDLLWYAAQMCKAFGKNIAAVAPDMDVFTGWGTETTISALYRNTGTIAGLVKKRVFHGAPPVNPFVMLECLKATVGCVVHLLAMRGLTIEAACERNHAKRLARHPDGFSCATANARADEEEQQ